MDRFIINICTAIPGEMHQECWCGRCEMFSQVQMRMPGVEPGSQAWEARMMPLHYMRF